MKTSLFAKCLLSLTLISISPIGWAQEDEVISGELIYEIEDDFENKTSRDRYYIKESKSAEMKELKFPKGKIPKSLKGAKSGSKIKFRGKKSSREIQVSLANDGSDSPEMAFDVVSYPTTMIKGTRTVLAVRVNFTDSPATCTDEATIFKNVFDLNNPGSTKNFYRTNSQNNLDISGKVVSVKINYSVASSTSCDLANWRIAAQNALASAGHRLSDYQHAMYFLPPNVKCNFAGSGGVGLYNGTNNSYIKLCRQKTIAHELGHNLGMQHASSGQKNSSNVVVYGDVSDSMGGQSTNEEFNAPHKYQLGWIPTQKIQNISSTAATYRVSPLNADSATAAYPQVFRVLNPSNNDDYYISFRDKSGVFDATMPLTYANRLNIQTYNEKSGIIEYTYFLNALGVGGSYTLPGTSVTIKNISQTASYIEFAVNGGGGGSTPPSDTTLPSVSLSSPINGASYSVGSMVAASASASDNVAVAKVEFYVGGVLKYTDTVSPYSYSFSMPTSSSLAIKARAYDAAGNMKDSVISYIKNPTTVSDTTLPIVSLSSPANGASYSAGSMVAASASASDNVKVAKVEFYVGGVLKFSDTISPYSYSFSMPTSSSLAIKARAYDSAGNMKDSVISYIKNPTTVSDTTLPIVSLSSPANGASYSAGSMVAASASASDNVKVAKVEFYVGGVLKFSDTISPYSYSFSMPTSSSLAIKARAYDSAGNFKDSATSYIKNPTTVSDTTLPIVSLSSPANGASYSAGSMVAASASASDNVKVAKVDFYVGGVLKFSDTISPYSYSFSMPTSSSLAIKARAYDSAGNFKDSATSYIKNPVSTADTIAPSIPSGLSLSAKSKKSLYLSFRASTDNVKVSKYEIMRNGVLIASTTSTSYSSSIKPNNSYTFKVRAVDTSGNRSAWSSEVSFGGSSNDIEVTTRGRKGKIK